MMMGGAPMAGNSRSAANPGGGLPFAGVPSEMQAGVDKLLAEEPDHGVVAVGELPDELIGPGGPGGRLDVREVRVRLPVGDVVPD